MNVDVLISGQLAHGFPAHQSQPEFSPDKAIDGNDDTRWGCDWGTHSAWLEVDLGEPRALGRVHLSEPYGRVRRFELQREENGQWKPFYRGTTIGQPTLTRFYALHVVVVPLAVAMTAA